MIRIREPQDPRLQVLAGHLYGTCRACGVRVRYDRPLLGKLHVCVPKEKKP